MKKTAEKTEEKLAKVYSELIEEDGHYYNKKVGACPWCGKESTLILPAIKRPGSNGGIRYYKDPLEEEGRIMFPVTPEELLAGEAAKTIQREYEDAQLVLGKLLIKIQKAHGRHEIDKTGQVVSKGRDEKFVLIAPQLEAAEQGKVDEIGKRLVAARQVVTKLHQERVKKMLLWKINTARERAGVLI